MNGTRELKAHLGIEDRLYFTHTQFTDTKLHYPIIMRECYIDLNTEIITFDEHVSLEPHAWKQSWITELMDSVYGA